jgi:hypothetical protein
VKQEGPVLVATREALALITSKLAPYVGQTMAEASLKMHCERLGIGNDGALSVDDLERLIGRLSGALSVFVGGQTSETLMASIRAGLAAGDGK